MCVYVAEVFWQQNLGYMQPRDLDDIMNGIVKDKLGVIPEGVVWGGIVTCCFALLQQLGLCHSPPVNPFSNFFAKIRTLFEGLLRYVHEIPPFQFSSDNPKSAVFL